MKHFHFPSAEPEKTADFYETFFGFRKLRRLGNTQVLADRANFLLAIDECEACAPPPDSTHLGFCLESREQVPELYARLQAQHEVTELREPTPKVSHFYCQDPTGNRLEVGWYDL